MKFLKMFPPQLLANLMILISSDASYDQVLQHSKTVGRNKLKTLLLREQTTSGNKSLCVPSTGITWNLQSVLYSAKRSKSAFYEQIVQL